MIVRRNHIRWWSTFFVITFNKLKVEGQTFQIWPTQSFNDPIFQTAGPFETKTLWRVSPTITKNSEENDKVLEYFYALLCTFLITIHMRLPFSKWNLQTKGFFSTQAYVLTIYPCSCGQKRPVCFILPLRECWVIWQNQQIAKILT